MKNKIFIFTILYFLLVNFIFWNPALGEPFREGNRFYECGAPVYLVGDKFLISSSNSLYAGFWTSYSAASSSGTSECTGSIGKNNDEKFNYFVKNFDEIQVNVAKGEGLHLDGLSIIMGCERNNLKIILKRNYETIFNEDKLESKKIYKKLKRIINNSELKNHCIDYS